jgi:ribosomal protein S27AE
VLPQRILCGKCGAILYEGMELTPPDEVIQRFDGKCPQCGKKLSFNPINVEIKRLK